MAKEQFYTIKEAKLNNNCPECYNNTGLVLTFKQKFKETSFYKSITNDTAHELNCTVCNTTIYPARWTEDLERVFDYQQRAFAPRKASTKLKKTAWLVIGVFFAIIITAIAWLVLWH